MTLDDPTWLDLPSPRLGTDEAGLWRDWTTTRSSEARQQLFSIHATFARQIARQHLLGGVGDVEFADLHQLACAGLLEAIDHFDPAYGGPFRAYARRRISGSVLDGIAKMSETREQLSFRNRVRRDRVRSLSIADPEALSADEAMRLLADFAVGLAVGFMLEGTDLYIEDEQPSRRPDAYESLAWKDTVRGILQALGELPAKEQTVVRQHYLEGLDFEHIGELLGLSKGRISQLHRAGLEQLRRRLSKVKGFRLTR